MRDAVSEYSKRLSRYCKLNIIELPDEKLPNKNLSFQESEIIKDKECQNILSHLDKSSYIIGLDLKGKEYSSENFSKKLDFLSFEASSITFIIGGSLGLTNNLIQKCNETVCFSKLTFPHQLIRVFLLEQLFRAFKISHGETYHR